MAIPEAQLETWAHQGAIATVKSTANSIKNSLEDEYYSGRDRQNFGSLYFVKDIVN